MKIKAHIFSLLSNNVIGSIILFLFKEKTPDMRWPGFRFNLKNDFVSKKNIASVFWGFYESAEIRFIEKYLNETTDVIELGSSLGVVSSHIVSRLCVGQKLICVEANPNLVRNIEENIKRANKQGCTVSVINKAIGYHSKKVYLQLSSNNTETRVSGADDKSDQSICIETSTLQQIVNDNLTGNYTLVCDIEGSEIELLINDEAVLKKCTYLFIELHDTIYNTINYTVKQLRELIVSKHGFKEKDSYGNVYYFVKS